MAAKTPVIIGIGVDPVHFGMIMLVNPVIDQLQQSKGGLLSVGIVIALWTASAGVRLSTL